ncbi:MAG: glycosyltransferase family 2 protein, partial [Proteobacteria bacterium]|nr:glycosyltransferase family 2 protein [Pseudomonadota bacterium]
VALRPRNSRLTPGPPGSVARDSSTGNLCFESASVALRPRNSRLTPGPPGSVARDSSTGNLCFESASVALRPRNSRLTPGPPGSVARDSSTGNLCFESASVALRPRNQGPVAVSSNLKVGNRHHWLTVWQSLEYVTGLNIDRRAQAALGCITTVPGAASAFSRRALLDVGGYSSDTVTEDTDLTLTLLRRGYSIAFQPRAWTFTESPDTFRALMAQRTRWLFGYLQCIFKHRGAFFRVNSLGWFGMPNLLFVHLLVYLLFPISALYLARIPHWMDWSAFFVLVAAFFVVDLTTSLFAYIVDGDDKAELLYAPAQRFFWPFFLWVVFARVCWASLRASSVPWKKLKRQGQLAQAVVNGQGPGIIK